MSEQISTLTTRCGAEEISFKKRPIFTLQWHLTTACLNHCRHCYMERNPRVLSLKECKKIIDDFKSLIERWHCIGRIHFTGGDPLLYPYLFKLLEYCHFRAPDIILGILGNPELLTGKIVKKLKEEGIYSYQMSIDGLEDTHDYFRYSGSFKNTLEKLRLLREYSIKTMVLTTVSKMNLREITNIIDLVTENEIDIFDFHRFIPIGNGSKIKEEALISPLEFRQLFSEADKKYKEYKDSTTFFGRKEPLWKLYQFEEGTFSIKRKGDGLIWSGCSIGCSGMSILEDGTVLACRRVPIRIGKVPEQSLRDIFIFSEKLNKMREVKNLKTCNDCELFLYCRGCRAMAYAVNGDYFASDPQCWKLKKKGGEK